MSSSLRVSTKSAMSSRRRWSRIHLRKALRSGSRRFLAFTMSSMVLPSTLPLLCKRQVWRNWRRLIGDLMKRAADSVAALGDNGLTHEVAHCLGRFAETVASRMFFDVRIHRHEEALANKEKLSWLAAWSQAQHGAPGRCVRSHPTMHPMRRWRRSVPSMGVLQRLP